jgi:hypothetical protein
MSAFDEIGNKILGKSATDMVRLKDNDYVEYQRVFRESLLYAYNFKCKAKVERYNVSIFNFGDDQSIEGQLMVNAHHVI